jgi:hypothetical protein
MGWQDEKNKDNGSEGTIDNNSIKLRGDTKRVKIIKEVSNLAHIPEIEEILTKTLEEAKERYAHKIEEYQNLKKNYENELEEKIVTGMSKSKSYFFELTRHEDLECEAGHQWELGKFKLNVNGKILDMIFSEFIANIDQYETAPNQIQTETVYSAPLNRSFQINFTKSGDNRAVGFVKIIEENFVKRQNDTMLTVATTTPTSLQVQKERVSKAIEDNPGFGEDISFYAHVIQQANGYSAFQ